MNIRKLIREELQFIFNETINKPIKSEIKLSDLYVESDNILDAYFKAKNNLGPSSRSTDKPLAVTKLLDDSLILMDGHHRIVDKIKYLDTDNIDDILNLKFGAIITPENYEDLEDFPDGEYYIPLFDWIYDMKEQVLIEDISVPIKENKSKDITCKNCDWEWDIEIDDKNPHLCHKCGFDNKKDEFDYVELNNWKAENNH